MNVSNAITHYVVGSARNIFLGANLCHAMENENYTHIPIILVLPSIYTGYNTYKNKDTIINYLNQNIKLKPPHSMWPF